jgi:NADH:ubiquinone oxidoreductase subunit K
MNPELLYHRPQIYLLLAAFLFAAGVFGMVRRRTLIGMLIAGELIFSAASLNFMTVNQFYATDPTVGQVAVLFIMALAAAEVSIALSIIIAVYRNYRSITSRELSDLNG